MRNWVGLVSERLSCMSLFGPGVFVDVDELAPVRSTRYNDCEKTDMSEQCVAERKKEMD